MKRKVLIVLTTFVITVCARAQTVITPKGTTVKVDTGYWGVTGGNIYKRNTGNVGIGVTNPDAPLHINGNTITTTSLSRSYFQQGSGAGISRGTGTTGSIQVHANGWYWADGGGFVATSDARIKNIRGLTSTARDLETLKKIAITDYTYIDQITYSGRLQKKVIAQQLYEVFPIAVSKNTGVIPGVFETAADSRILGSITQITTAKAHGFNTGDLVKLVTEETGEKILEATVLNNRSFTVAEPVAGKIFVYGKQVNDLLSVDYDAIATLNVSATQELARQLQLTQNKMEQLEAENKHIIDANNELKKILSGIQTRLKDARVRTSAKK